MGILTEGEIKKCREAFDIYDKDGSGAVDQWELRQALESMVGSSFLHRFFFSPSLLFLHFLSLSLHPSPPFHILYFNSSLTPTHTTSINLSGLSCERGPHPEPHEGN